MDYLIDYKEDEIVVWSSKRLQFEPTDRMKEMRNSLRKYIKKSLNHKNKKFIYAFYSSEKDKEVFSDIENILFYNVGVDSFKNNGTRGIVFKRIFKSPKPIKIDSSFVRTKYDMAVGHLLLRSFWANEAVF